MVVRRIGIVVLALLLLHGVPWWVLVMQPDWAAPAGWIGTAVALAITLGFPVAMYLGHGRAQRDLIAVGADTWLGIVWQLLAWSVIGEICYGIAVVGGASAMTAARWTAAAVASIVLVLCLWGLTEALRVPRVRSLDVAVERLAAEFDGLRLVVIGDTHYGPIDRAGWSSRLVALVNGLDADVVAHLGDIADGGVARRRVQVAPLSTVIARRARVYITGNHEYYSAAADWVKHMDALGWTVLHNRHLLLRGSGGAALAIAGVDDATAAHAGVPGHGSDLTAALDDIAPDVPVVLLSHQPKSVSAAVERGVDLQLSGHTHGGQIWPFHLLVRWEQRALQGLSAPGGRTQLYTSRGSGFWGPPFRVFAPSEVTVISLRAGAGGIVGRS